MKNKIYLIAIAIVVLGGIIFVAIKQATREPASSGIPIQSHRTYSLRSNVQLKNYIANTPSEYSFSIVDERGDILRNFATTHTKPMHVIVVRKDLAHFQHVHPEYNALTGNFVLKDLTFPSDGEYRIFADFAVDGAQKDPKGNPLAITLSEDVKVGTMYKPLPLGTEEKSKTFDGLLTTLNTHGTPASGAESMLTFSLSQNGKSVTDLQEYLGALGHVVILREGTLDFIHAHPVETQKQDGTVSFVVYFPEAGRYKVFAQFQRGGKVITAEFVVSVIQNTATEMRPGANHLTH